MRRAAVEAGVQSESITFAAWEDSGRGIASKLMARMGFKRGAGLGRRGKVRAKLLDSWARSTAATTTRPSAECCTRFANCTGVLHKHPPCVRLVYPTAGGGITDPLEITILPSKRGLGAATKHKTQKAAGTGAHSSKHHGKISGRKRKRMKAAAARHAAKTGDRQRQAEMEAATGEQGLFAFINDSLGHGSEAAAKLQAAGVYGPDEGGKQRQQTGGGAALAAAAAAAAAAGGGRGAGQQQKQQQQQPSDRKGLVGSQDDLSALKVRLHGKEPDGHNASILWALLCQGSRTMYPTTQVVQLACCVEVHMLCTPVGMLVNYPRHALVRQAPTNTKHCWSPGLTLQYNASNLVACRRVSPN